MATEHSVPPIEEIVQRVHKYDLAVRLIVGTSVVIGTTGSLALRWYAQLGLGHAIIIALLLTLVATQIPLLVPWVRHRAPITLSRSIHPFFGAALAALIVALFFSRNMASAVRPDRPVLRGRKGYRGCPDRLVYKAPKGCQLKRCPIRKSTLSHSGLPYLNRKFHNHPRHQHPI